MGYGATAKSSTMINYAGLGPELIESICDVTPAKQGRFSPGAHIPIVPYERFTADYPDVELEHALVDSCALRLITDPSETIEDNQE